MTFEDWVQDKGGLDGYCKDYQDAYDEGFDEGVLSKQIEIDNLKSKNVKLEIQILQVQQSCGGCDSRDLLITELQERIDEAIKTLEQSKPNMMRQYDAIQALNILKGNKYD